MIQLLVVADDLTGANDCGVQFAKKGIGTFVTTDPALDIKTLPSDVQVLVVDTESRHLSPVRSARRVKKAVTSARRCGVRYFYKKTDSTLRGNIGAELDAALTASGGDVLVFVPAFPKMGRFTKKGFHYLGDELMHRTQYGVDPLVPVMSSYVPEVVTNQTSRTVAALSFDEHGRLDWNSVADAQIVIVDCRDDIDLQEIGRDLRTHNLHTMTAGSAGFAEILPELLQLPVSSAKITRPEGPLLIVNGSLNEISLKQVACAENCGVATAILSEELVLTNSVAIDEQITALCNRLIFHAATGVDVIVRSVATREDLQVFLSNTNSENETQIYRNASRNTGRIVSQIFKNAAFKTLVVFGGDTLIAIMKALSITGIRPLEEIAPGIVLSEVEGEKRPFWLVSKAGGFGDEGVIMDIIDYVRAQK